MLRYNARPRRIRRSAWLLALLLVLGACGTDTDDTNEGPEDAAPPDPEDAEEEPADTDDPASVRIAFGGTVDLYHPQMYVGGPAGFWEDELLDVDVVPTDGSTQALQLLEAGQVDFMQVTPETVIFGRAEGIPVVSVFTVNKFSSLLCVDEASDIQSVAELAGEQIGVPSATSGLVPFTRAVLEDAGLDPDADAEFVPTGFGPAAAEGLRAGDVAAIAYWAGYYVQTESLGFEYRCFGLPGLETAPGHVLATLESVIEEDPSVVERLGRAHARGIVWGMEHPSDTVQAYWDVYPDAMSADMDEDEALAVHTGELERHLPAQFVWDTPDWQLGYNDPDGWTPLVEFMVDSGQLDASVPTSDLIVNDFVDSYSDFDVDETLSRRLESG